MSLKGVIWFRYECAEDSDSNVSGFGERARLTAWLWNNLELL